MKTLFYGMLLLTVVILVTAVAVDLFLKAVRYVSEKVKTSKDLLEKWDDQTPVEIRPDYDPEEERYYVQIRKKCRRLFKNSGWKYVNRYVDSKLGWQRVYCFRGLAEQEKLLRDLIHTYKDVDVYFYPRVDQYLKDKQML